MTIQLPPKSDGTRQVMPDNTRQLTIVGANGSGKTRFTDYLIGELEGHSFRLSALNALYGSHPDCLPWSIDSLYKAASAMPSFLHNDAVSTFDRLVALMFNEEIACLVAYKTSRDSGKSLPETKLDKVITMWENIFPGNQILREGGQLLFARDNGHKAYSRMKLSDGEKAVLYYLGAVLYAASDAVIFVDNPGIFLHPSMLRPLWDKIEELRPDCTFIYTTHDLDFAASSVPGSVIWVRGYNAEGETWDYDLLPASAGITDDIYKALIGARKPVLFIEGDATHSIDAKLYPLIFPEYTVKSLGSCNKVIEATRTFNDLSGFHHLDSRGIVDRDRRDDNEVRYLRDKRIFVPEVAEIENILMLEEVVRTVAHRHRKDENRVFSRVKASIIGQFRHDLKQQALLHTRHRVKRTVEYRIDGRFANIHLLEQHMANLLVEINPRGLYEGFCREFRRYVELEDYASVLKVYNQKSMIPGSNVAQLCGVNGGKDGYVKAVLSVLRENGRDAARMRAAIRNCFGITGNN